MTTTSTLFWTGKYLRFYKGADMLETSAYLSSYYHLQHRYHKPDNAKAE
jgi:hypothetical protein